MNGEQSRRSAPDMAIETRGLRLNPFRLINLSRRGIGDRDNSAVAVQRRQSSSSGMTDLKARSSKLHRFAEIAR
jgi:hypothetical protein